MTQLADIPNQTGLPDAATSRSSIYEKLTPEIRRKVDRAIVSYDPVSYRAIYKKFTLTDQGISFTAFYYYAKKLRERGAALELAQDVLKDDAPSLTELLPNLIGQHLVEQIMANDQLGPDAIYKLTLAHRTAFANAEAARKQKAVGDRHLAGLCGPGKWGTGNWGTGVPPVSIPTARSPQQILALCKRIAAAEQCGTGILPVSTVDSQLSNPEISNSHSASQSEPRPSGRRVAGETSAEQPSNTDNAPPPRELPNASSSNPQSQIRNPQSVDPLEFLESTIPPEDLEIAMSAKDPAALAPHHRALRELLVKHGLVKDKPPDDLEIEDLSFLDENDKEVDLFAGCRTRHQTGPPAH